MDRLPHIAMVGDSLSRDFYVSSLVSMIWRSKMNHGCDWFLDTDASASSIHSIYERLAQETPVVACEYSSVGGRVDSGGGGHWFCGSWYPFNFSQQVDLILKEQRFPDLVLIWIGHNNLHWEWVVDPRRPEEIEIGLQKMAANFRQDYARQLGRLVERTPVVRIFGMEYHLEAEVVTLNGFSNHADQPGLLDYAQGFKPLPERTFVVHGDPDAAAELATRLRRDLGMLPPGDFRNWTEIDRWAASLAPLLTR